MYSIFFLYFTRACSEKVVSEHFLYFIRVCSEKVVFELFLVFYKSLFGKSCIELFLVFSLFGKSCIWTFSCNKNRRHYSAVITANTMHRDLEICCSPKDLFVKVQHYNRSLIIYMQKQNMFRTYRYIRPTESPIKTRNICLTKLSVYPIKLHLKGQTHQNWPPVFIRKYQRS